MGYETYNPVVNMGTLFIISMVYFVRLIVLVCILRPLSRRDKKYKKQEKILRRKLIFSEFLLIALEGLLEMLIASILNFKDPSFNFSAQGMIAIIVLLLSLVVLPAILTKFSLLDLNQIKDDKRFEALS